MSFPKALPQYHFTTNNEWPVPDRLACEALWDHYAMPDHIREHSTKVAHIAYLLAQKGAELSFTVHPDMVLASAYYTILQKHTILYGGSHVTWSGMGYGTDQKSCHCTRCYASCSLAGTYP